MPGAGVVLSRVPVRDGDGPAGVTVYVAPVVRQGDDHGVCSHDDIANVKGRQTDRSAAPDRNRLGVGVARVAGRPGAGSPPSPLMLPLVFGLLGSPTLTPPARGDELADARARAAEHEEARSQLEKAQVAQLNALQASLSADIASTRHQLARHQRRPGGGQVEDHPDDQPDQGRPEDLQRPGARAADARRGAGPPPVAGGPQADRAGRAQGAAGRAHPERLRHRPDVAARVVPVERVVHRPAGPDELLHRRRRAGQGPRRPDRQGPGDLAAIHQTPSRPASGPTSLRQRPPPRSAP